MFQCNELYERCNVKGSYGDLAEAFKKEKVKVAYAVSQWKNTRDIYYTSDEESYDPIFTLLTLGRCDGATLNYPKDRWSRSESGIVVFRRAVDDTYRFAATEVKPANFSLPEGPGKDFYHYLTLPGLKEELQKRFPVSTGADKIVDDIRSVVPSKRGQDGSYEVAGMHTVHRLYLATAFTLLHKKHGTGRRDGVIALLVDKQGRIISWGQKNEDLWHGETSAVLGLGGTIPAGSVVYSTLKPCHMCSGLLHAASKGDIRVYWGQDDPGKAAQMTVLEKDKTGSLMNGNKFNGLPRALLLGSKPKPGERDERKDLGSRLDERFKKDRAKYDQASTIDFIVSDEAKQIILQAEMALREKQKKYQATTGGNENTRKVIEYLIGFLKDRGCPPEALGKD